MARYLRKTLGSLIAGLAVSILPTTAVAAPVFLNCTVPDTLKKNPVTVMQVQLNEDNGTAAWSFDNGNSFTKPAIFAPNKVSFGGFQINRMDLSIIRFNDGIYAKVANGGPWEDHGKCEVARQQRAF